MSLFNALGDLNKQFDLILGYVHHKKKLPFHKNNLIPYLSAQSEPRGHMHMVNANREKKVIVTTTHSVYIP